MRDDRIVVVGYPRSGKTTAALRLGRELGLPVRHTDDAMDLGWSDASEEVSRWFDEGDGWIIEGVAVPRAVRKWRSRNAGNGVFPYTHAVELWEARGNLTEGQRRMGEAARAVWDEVLTMARDDPRDSKGRLWFDSYAVNPDEVFIGQEPGVPARFSSTAFETKDGTVRTTGRMLVRDGHGGLGVGKVVSAESNDGLYLRGFISSASPKWQQLAIDEIAGQSIEGEISEAEWQDEGEHLLITEASLSGTALVSDPAMTTSTLEIVRMEAAETARKAPVSPERAEAEIPLSDIGPALVGAVRCALGMVRDNAAGGGKGGGR